MDKDIHNEIDDEIEGIVYDDNDTDAMSDSDTKKADDEEVGLKNSEDETEENEETDSQVIEEESTEEAQVAATGIEQDSLLDRIAAKKKKMRRLKFALLIPAIGIIIAGMITLYVISERNEKYDNLLNVDYFYEGVYVDDIALGGLTLDEAKKTIANSNNLRANNVQTVLFWDDEKIKFGSEDVNIDFNTQDVLDEAWQEGRAGTDRQRYDYVMNLAQIPIYFSTNIDVDPSPLESKIKAVALFKQSDPGEASVKFDPNPEIDGSEWFEYSEPKKGITTDPVGLWKTVEKSLIETAAAEVEIPKWEVEPTTTIDDLKNMTQLIVQFKTHMVRSSNREHNVRLASSMINGTVLMPGEVFSMNETTGKRTKAAGFKEANVIVGGNRLEPGIAGGVCQVSGTLFNAAVRADLEIVERHHHSFELSYLTRGRDATVNYGTADLRFKNTGEFPIYISMYTIGRDVYAEIYGVPLADGMTIELYIKTTRTENPGFPVAVADATVPYGTTETYSARTGIKCTTYKDYYDADGKLVDRVELHRDYYRPYAKEIHYNPAAGVPIV